MLLAILGAAGYVGVRHELLFFDSLQITQDLTLTSIGASIRRLIASHVGPSQALCDLTFAINHAINRNRGLPGFHAAGFYLVNVAIHVVNVWLVYLLVSRLFAQRGSREEMLPAFLAAALFAVHPLHVSSIAYVIQRRGLLASTFYALCLICYLAARARDTKRARAAWAIAAGISGFLSMKCKAVAMTFPAAILVLEFCLRATDRRALRRILILSIPLVVAVAGYATWFLVASSMVDTSGGLRGMNMPDSWGVMQQILSQSVATLHEWRLILLPLPGFLSIDHLMSPSPGFTDGMTILSLMVNLGILTIGIRAAFRGAEVLSFGILLFYVTKLPYFIFPQTELLVEYKSYLSGVGVAFIAAHLLRASIRRLGESGPGVAVAFIGILLGITTWQRSRLFEDPVALWNDVVRKYPRHIRAYANLGNILSEKGRFDEAIVAFRKVQQLDPENAQMHFFIGNALRDGGHHADAAEAFRLAAQANPGNLGAYVNQANELLKLERLDEAIASLRNGLLLCDPKTDPLTRATAYFNLGNLLARNRRLDEAEKAYTTATEIAPLYPNAYLGLGFVQEVRGKLTEAAAYFNTALGLNPNYAEAAAALERVQPSLR